MRQNNGTKAWELYEQGRRYNNSLVPNQYRLVNTNIDFFAGNQWRNIPQTEAMARLPKPVFNIIKRVTSLFVASLTSARFKLAVFPAERLRGRKRARAGGERGGVCDGGGGKSAGKVQDGVPRARGAL